MVTTSRHTGRCLRANASCVPWNHPGGDEELGQAQERLKDVGLIVLDEVHYLGDPSRGSVWWASMLPFLDDYFLA